MLYSAIYVLEDQDDRVLTNILMAGLTDQEQNAENILTSLSNRENVINALKEYEPEKLIEIICEFRSQLGMDQILAVNVDGDRIFVGMDVQSAFENNIGRDAAALILQQFSVPFGLKIREYGFIHFE